MLSVLHPPIHSMTDAQTNNPRVADTTTIGRLIIDDQERIIGDNAEQEGEDLGDHEGGGNEGDHEGENEGADELDLS